MEMSSEEELGYKSEVKLSGSSCFSAVLTLLAQSLIGQQAGGGRQHMTNGILHFLYAAQKAATVTGQLLPGAAPVLRAAVELLHLLAETHLEGRHQGQD